MAKSSIIPHRVIFGRRAQDRLEVMIGGGWPSLIGLGFLLPGLTIMLIGSHLIPVSGQDFIINGIPVFGLFGLPLVIVGCSMICYRRWLTFDVSRRLLVTQSGWLTPMRRRERSLQEFTSVSIDRLINSSSDSNSSGEYFSVILTTQTKGNGYTINNCRTYQEAYTQAATIAEFLGIPVRDMSSDHPVEIAPSDLARPLQARLRVDAAVLHNLSVPATLRSQVEEAPHGVQLIVPAPMNNRWRYAVVLVIAIPAVVMFLTISASPLQADAGFFRDWMIGFVMLVGGLSVLAMLRDDWVARHSSTVVAINSEGATIEERRVARVRKSVLIPMADMIDIDYNLVNDRRWGKFSGNLLGGAKGITLKTKTGLHTFSAGLPDAEVEYLAMVVMKTFAAVQRNHDDTHDSATGNPVADYARDSI